MPLVGMYFYKAKFESPLFNVDFLHFSGFFRTGSTCCCTLMAMFIFMAETFTCTGLSNICTVMNASLQLYPLPKSLVE